MIMTNKTKQFEKPVIEKIVEWCEYHCDDGNDDGDDMAKTKWDEDFWMVELAMFFDILIVRQLQLLVFTKPLNYPGNLSLLICNLGRLGCEFPRH